MTAMITIPTFQDREFETAARLWPPTMVFRMRYPWSEKTFRALGMIDP